jgi:ribosomal-protein-serine acetyltransferase
MFVFPLWDRAELRLLETRHADEFFQLVKKNFNRLALWCPWLDRVATADATRAFLRDKIDRFAAGNGFTSGVFLEGRIVGVVALEYVDSVNLTTEIGYWLDSEVEGKGLVINSSRALIDHAFDDLKLRRVQIRCATENRRSRAIPEKLGFVQEGIIRSCESLPDRNVDLVVYGMLAEEWREAPARAPFVR